MEVTVEGRRLRLTSLDKVLFPSVGFTKAEVLDYYARIAPVLLPYLAGRPMTLKRAPLSFASTKGFARQVAETLAARLPARVVARADKRLRGGRVLVDWGQNDRHKSTVAPYSLRAKRPFPTVSAPLTWDELAAAVDRGDERALLLGPGEVLARVESGGDPFAPVLSVTQSLPG